MIGTLVNALAIISGSLLGLFFKKGIPDSYKKTMLQAMGLAIVLIGIKSALKTDDLLLLILSLAIGSFLGELLRIENRLENLGLSLEKKFSKGGGGFSKGFVAASLVFCVGSMAIVGALESGLTGNHQTLFAKSTIDGILSVIFASTLGIGVMFSSVSVFLYQGLITLLAVVIKPFLTPDVITQMSSTGGLLIAAIGLNTIGISKIKVGNMLPAIFIPLIYFAARSLFFP
jgi:uncharacterized protein